MTSGPQDFGTVVEFPQANQHGLRKPRLALMGEFSAGKSTLANLLAGASRLPVQVTATQLPPVWISQGSAAPYRVDLDGKSIPVSLARLTDIPVAETAYVRIFLDSPTLAICDIIDMPGISDPNMPSDVWQRVLPHADGIIWCTHATQAWRQSESATWAAMPPELQQRSLLLLTRIDKIVCDKDRQRIIKRLNRETEGLFARVCLPISLTGAIAGLDDQTLWESSGATAFFTALRDIVNLIANDLGQGSSVSTVPASVLHLPGLVPTGEVSQSVAVLPRRVRVEQSMTLASRRPSQPNGNAKIAAFRTMDRHNKE